MLYVNIRFSKNPEDNLLPILTLLSSKSWKQLQCILLINRLPHPRIHLISLERLITPLSLERRIRKITPIQHPIPRRPLEQRIQNIRTPAQRGIEIEALRVFRDLLPMRRLVRQQFAEQSRAERIHPPGQVWQRPARVREDNFARRELPLATTDDQIARRARRLVWVVNDGLR